jgi:hypothetical protein
MVVVTIASGYVVSPVPGRSDQARVAYVVQTDPKGWLPTKVVNVVAKSQVPFAVQQPFIANTNTRYSVFTLSDCHHLHPATSIS